MTFVAQPTSSLDKKGAPPKKEEAPKPINELMGSFRIGGGFPQVSAAPKTSTSFFSSSTSLIDIDIHSSLR